ncbi:MAG: FmdB family zinc ribbon protein [Chloroflexota bacterium]
MPVYAYRCESCGVRIERHQGFHDAPLKICPECRKKTLKKIIAPVGIVFKGSGFYATDHKSPSGQSSHRHSKKEESKAEASESKPAESKSESKAE